jgi:hypothetical protein
MSDYDTHILLWSEQQATLLLRLSGGEAVNPHDDRTPRKRRRSAA